MPDSIFDMQQTLFTSNAPLPLPRDRAQDRSTSFDQALNAANEKSRDDRRAHEAQQSKAADNRHNDQKTESVHTNDATQDEVTLSSNNTASTETQAIEITGVIAPPDGEVGDSKPELTAEDIAAAAGALPGVEQPRPVLQQPLQPEAEQSEQHEGIELNDAVVFNGKKTPATAAELTPASNNEQPIHLPEVPATTEEIPVVDSNAAVIVSELHAAKHTNKAQQILNHSEQQKSDTSKEQPSRDELKKATAAGEFAEGAFAVTLTPQATGESSTPKRKLETTRQVMPEVHDADPNPTLATAIGSVVDAVTAIVSAEPPPDTAKTTAESPSITPAAAAPNETPAPTNHLRGPQIPHSFANHLESASGERKSNDPQNTVDRTRFVQRVARAFHRASETEGEIRLRLSPPELGAVKLEVSLRDGAMVARMETETATARNLLMDNLPQLKERLAEQNVRIETFEVEVRDQSNQSAADDAREQLREQSDLQRNRLRGERASTPVVAQPIVRTLPTAHHSSQLNVVI